MHICPLEMGSRSVLHSADKVGYLEYILLYKTDNCDYSTYLFQIDPLDLLAPLVYCSIYNFNKSIGIIKIEMLSPDQNCAWYEEQALHQMLAGCLVQQSML